MKLNPIPAAHLLAAGVLLGASLLSARAQIPWATEPYSRQNKFEAYGIGQYLHQDHTDYPGLNGSTIRMTLDDTGLGGAGVAWHFNDFFAVRAEFMFGPANFHAQAPGGPSVTLGQNAYLQTGRCNLDYNIINRRLTPFLTAGLGYQYLEVEQRTYAGQYYYYDSYYSESDFTWNVGAGVRWDITDRIFIKLSGGAQWLQYQDARNVTTQIEAFLTIGAKFP